MSRRTVLPILAAGVAAGALVVFGGPFLVQSADEGPPDSSTPPPADAAAGPEQARPNKPRYDTLALRGRVVWLAEALKRRFGIETDRDAAEWQVALETPGGEIYPIAKDNRGRGFMIDPRLRDADMELLVRRYQGSPVVQVIRIYTFKGEDKFELDYWCDVCAIQMFELKKCECCQGPTRIRERKVVPKKAGG